MPLSVYPVFVDPLAARASSTKPFPPYIGFDQGIVVSCSSIASTLLWREKLHTTGVTPYSHLLPLRDGWRLMYCSRERQGGCLLSPGLVSTSGRARITFRVFVICTISLSGCAIIT
jgi:hypothetical protein